MKLIRHVESIDSTSTFQKKSIMNARKVIICAAVFLALLGFVEVSGLSSCNFNCQRKPTLLDYMYPTGCYCHSTCGGKLRCCRDKERYCGSGGAQACMIPKKVYRATVVGGEKLFYRRGETITYECPYQYEIKGSARRTCIGDNIWSPGPPRCNRLTFVCRPPSIKNGNYGIAEKHYTSGDSITITCNSGYVLEGARTLRCLLYKWSDYTPSCIRDRCATITYCSKDATCKNYEYYSKCLCNEGYTGDGWRCARIPCYKHNCKKDEICVDSGDGSGDYTCDCKQGYIRDGASCVVDPCFNNDCHANATCSVVDKTKAECSCNSGHKGNGTSCAEAKCNPSEVHGAEITGMCDECEEICCEKSKLRKCRICIHMKCNGGEVCAEDGLSKVPTVCTENECHENEGGFTVETPDYVHCLDEEGLRKKNMNCCWVGE